MKTILDDRRHPFPIYTKEGAYEAWRKQLRDAFGGLEQLRQEIEEEEQEEEDEPQTT